MIDRFFDGDTTAYENQVPVNAIRNHAPTHQMLIIGAGEKDTTSIRNVKTIAPVAAKAGMRVAAVESSGNAHDWHAVQDVLRYGPRRIRPRHRTGWCEPEPIRLSESQTHHDMTILEHKPASLRIPEKERNDSNANRAAKPAEASPAKPLFGFCALLADLAGWIRRHLLTVCLVLFVIINVGTQIVCALIVSRSPPSLAKVSFEAAHAAAGTPHRYPCCTCRIWAVCSSTFRSCWLRSAWPNR